MGAGAEEFIPHPFKDTDELLRVLTDNEGEIVSIGLSEDPIVWQASELGLVEVRLGDGWTMRDTVLLTPKSRLKMGLPPLVKKPTIAASFLHAAMTVFGKLFGTKRPIA
ncbi:hypothetical protein [Rhizobium sp. BK418]|uniref:hypothetical protein n=1 Tax=Rhizobium sp. BK418 TaxID=2512120 RepID=UPI001049B3CC|nr:hypothetical protein [Rhizobium sp. BK418]TCR95974.1 hypothetical protein EV281_11222 [Rhizobium sp. BK418]